MLASTVTSRLTARPGVPVATSASSVSFASCSFVRYPIATVQPDSASATAHARPIPRDPPVTTATLEVTWPLPAMGATSSASRSRPT
jgi:hypothetical protein